MFPSPSHPHDSPVPAEVEHIKGIKSPDDEQTAVLATEAEVKKALFEELQGAGSGGSGGSGLPSFEKTVAKEWGGPFLENLELNLEPYWISFLNLDSFGDMGQNLDCINCI